MKKALPLLLALMVGLGGYAQQDPLYSLYMTNMQAINPAYVGMHNSLIATVNYRVAMGKSAPTSSNNYCFGSHQSIW